MKITSRTASHQRKSEATLVTVETTRGGKRESEPVPEDARHKEYGANQIADYCAANISLREVVGTGAVEATGDKKEERGCRPILPPSGFWRFGHA